MRTVASQEGLCSMGLFS